MGFEPTRAMTFKAIYITSTVVYSYTHYIGNLTLLNFLTAATARAATMEDTAEERRRAEVGEARRLCFEGAFRDAAIDEYTLYRLLRALPLISTKN